MVVVGYQQSQIPQIPRSEVYSIALHLVMRAQSIWWWSVINSPKFPKLPRSEVYSIALHLVMRAQSIWWWSVINSPKFPKFLGSKFTA